MSLDKFEHAELYYIFILHQTTTDNKDIRNNE